MAFNLAITTAFSEMESVSERMDLEFRLENFSDYPCPSIFYCGIQKVTRNSNWYLTCIVNKYSH